MRETRALSHSSTPDRSHHPAQGPRIYCSDCGAVTLGKFCSSCGTPVHRAEDPSAEPPVRYSSEGSCSRCGKVVQLNARALHPRSCPANVETPAQASERSGANVHFTALPMHAEPALDSTVGRRGATPQPAATGGQPNRSRNVQRKGIAALAGAVVLLGGFLGFRALSASGSDDIQGAQKECLLASADVMDGGSTLALDVISTETNDIGPHIGTNLRDLSCALDALNTPTHVRKALESTSALDGQQTDEWGNLTARWRYSPDGSLQVVIRAR